MCIAGETAMYTPSRGFMDHATPPLPAPPPAPAVQQQVHHYYHPQKSGGVAALLEVLPGLFQVFGIGHMYAGNVATGLIIMFGYWAVAFVNFLLLFVLIGWVTWPLCWIAAMIISPLTAANACKSR
jgi:TM2 domain-containing membrane protein YozV